MNSLEDIIRAAAHATAQEVDPAGLPPLRLPGRQRRPTARLHGTFARGTRLPRFAAPLAAAAAAAAVVAAVAAPLAGGGSAHKVATGGHGHGRVAAVTGGVAAGSGTSGANAAGIRAGVIGLFMPATGAQFTAGALFHGQIDVLEGDATASCMASSGYHYSNFTAEQYVAMFGYWSNTDDPDLGLITRTGLLHPIYYPPREKWSKAYQRDYNRCSTAAAKPFASLLRTGFQLGSPFPGASANQTAPAVAATLPALRSCAARYGFPNSPYGDSPSKMTSFANFVDWISGFADGALSRGASEAKMLALDHHWAAIFVTCARPTVTVQYRIWLAQQRVFLRKHRAQVQALCALATSAIAASERQAGPASG